MFEIKIGDIVKPTTPSRRKQFGKGVVVANRLSQRLPFRVVFPSAAGLFQSYDFDYDHLLTTDVSAVQLERITKAEYTYNQMQADIIGV